jgi:hypothetical protein
VGRRLALTIVGRDKRVRDRRQNRGWNRAADHLQANSKTSQRQYSDIYGCSFVGAGHSVVE